MVAWTGHVRHVGCYGLDLPHELIPNPGVVLEQCQSGVKHDGTAFPVGQQLFLHLLILSEINFNWGDSVHFQEKCRNVSSVYQTNLIKTRSSCGSWLIGWLLPATAIYDLSDKIPFLCFPIYNISEAAGCTSTFQLKVQLGY